MAESLDNVRLSPDGTSVILLDQSLLPGRVEERQVRSLDEMVEAIRALRVRGAPAIGIFAGYCLYVLAGQLEGHQVTTIEGLAENGELDIIQNAFVEHVAIQCGFCTPGMIMSTKGLLLQNPDPSEEEIRIALSGNICRCSGYVQILAAVRDAAKKLREVAKA